MSIRFAVAAMIAALLSTAGAATVSAQDRLEMTKGSTVNITACVIRSLDDDDEFVLTNLTDMPAHPASAGKVVYWVDDVSKVRSYVGKRIQFDAIIKDVDRREVELKHANVNGNGDGGYIRTAVAEIEGPGNQVKAPPEAIGFSSTAGSGETSVASTLVEVDVRGNVTTVADSCATWSATTLAAAAAAANAEMRAAAVEESASAINTPRETTSVAIETPAAEVSAEAATTTTTPSVELDVDTTRTELPRTATPLPLFALFGLGSLIGAAALRVRR